MTTVDELLEAQERFERPIRVKILEQMFEFHLREYKAMERCTLFAGDHYTYRDSFRAHLIAAEWVQREHMGILKFVESDRRIQEIRDRVQVEHEKLISEQKIA
jgi:hypothetical protein